jgi:hypothetical protein
MAMQPVTGVCVFSCLVNVVFICTRVIDSIGDGLSKDFLYCAMDGWC